ncbi:ejaculatory bulb-specific protein 3-like [Homalodisca vitripennis]|uniref:ejaculatory bulb-specific protein 3-like n=1 Tax=Homalodisca vitripennis TaxID=197043 RepID=UPI001EEA23FE|nr:ejaculatory bulb-specific protein 3-like [Homalodisca vitripennis]KAG8330688.1 hypothetical protein J6590_057262 [Homalodisca vitripennis]
MARVLLLLSLVGMVAVVLAKPEEKYTTKYDNIDLDRILDNERLMEKATKCLMDEGDCTPDMAELKKALPDALQNECAKCSDKQKEGARKVLKFLIEKKKSVFETLEKKYDPEGVYRNKYQELAAKEGVKV